MKNKIATLFIVITFIVGIIIFLFQANSKVIENQIGEQMVSNQVLLAKKGAEQITQIFKMAEKELIAAAYSFPLQNLLAAFEKKDEEKIELWTSALTHRFAGMAETNLFASQLRFIDSSGQEIVRIDRKKDGNVYSVKVLQNKSKEFYFSKVMSLSPNEFYLSPITLNREFGKIEIPHREMIRFAVPVKHNKQKKGMVIMNIEMNTIYSIVDNLSEHAWLFNSSGKLLNCSLGLPQEYHDKAIKSIFQQKRDSFFLPLDYYHESGEKSLVGYYPVKNFDLNWYIGSELPFDEVSNIMSKSNKIKIVLFGIILISLIGLSIVVYKLYVDQQKAKFKTIINLFQEITITANEASSIEEAMQICLDKVCDYMGWPVGHVYITDSTGKLLPSRLWHIKNPQQFDKFRKITEATPFDPGVGLPGRVLAHGKPSWITDVTKVPNFPRAKLAKDIGVKAGFALPVLEDKKVVAVLEFFSDKAIEPDKSLLEALSNLATQLGRVTERKRAKEVMMELNRSLEKYACEMEHLAEERAKQLVRADRMASLGTLAAGVAHEINNPVGFISSNLQIFERLWGRSIKAYLEKAKEENEDENLSFALVEMPKMVKTMREGTKRISTIVHKLNGFSRVQEEIFEKVSISECIKTAVTFCSFGTTMKCKVDVQVNVPEDIPNIMMNRNEIEQVFVNLFNNAAYSMDVIIDDRKPTLKISAVYAEDEVVIETTDNGNGMDEMTLDKIFDPFYTTKETGKGTGLGLSICYGIIKKHRGTIKANSKLGEGTTFIITLPVNPQKKERRKKNEKIPGGLRKEDELSLA